MISAKHGWLWINEGVRYVIQNKYVWIATLLIFGLASIFIMYLLPIFQVFFVFVVPFITAGLSMACADIEKGKPMSVEYLFRAFTHPNRMNIFRYGFLLVLMMVIAQLLTSLLLAVYGISQEQIASEMSMLRENAQGASLFSLFDSSIMTAYMIASFFCVLPILVINMLSPVLLAFGQISSFDAVKLSVIAGVRNFSAFICYGVIVFFTMCLAALLFYTVNQILITTFGEKSVVASVVYMLFFLSITLLLISITYSSAYVAFKDIFLGKKV